MVFLVKVEFREGIHGKGVFAAEDIKKGTRGMNKMELACVTSTYHASTHAWKSKKIIITIPIGPIACTIHTLAVWHLRKEDMQEWTGQ